MQAVVTKARKAENDLPSNLRIEEYIPPKELYRRISEADRNVVSGLSYLKPLC